jgi:hypothetical protein
LEVTRPSALRLLESLLSDSAAFETGDGAHRSDVQPSNAVANRTLGACRTGRQSSSSPSSSAFRAS